jgi:hypothetical protein
VRRAIAAALGMCLAATEARAQASGLPASPAWVTISGEALRADFDTLWAVSDVHGRLQELDELLVAAELATRDGADHLVWNPARSRQLFVAVGDYIDGGPDGVGVVLRLDNLAAQAAAAGSRVVVLLGNHEAEFLADPLSADHRLLASAHRMAGQLGLPSRPGAEELASSEFGQFLRSLPVAAFVGSWLFAHAGYVDAEDGRAYFAGLGSSWSHPGAGRYRALLDPRSIVAYHDWWKGRGRRERMKVRLDGLGLNGLVFGHDPAALGVPGAIAMDPDGWLIKLDTGMKTGPSRGMLLRCEVARLLRETTLVMSAGGIPNCQAMTRDGSRQALSK